MGHRAIRNRAAHLIGALALLLASLLPASANAWGYYGHQTTAQIALANVKPETRTAIARLIAHESELGTPECRMDDLAGAATWPDCLRGSYWRWAYTFAWHYRTAPVCEAYDAKKHCSGGNCVTAQVERNFRILSDESLPANVRLEALAFMVHFAGDVHMPLHSGDKDDRGGNDRVTDYGIVPDRNLHSIWDTALAERAITAAEPPLVRHYSAQEKAAFTGGDPAEWGRESWQIARDFVYPNAFDRDACEGDLPDETALTQEDIVAAVPVVERRVTQAGLRIADLLDAAFAPGAASELP